VGIALAAAGAAGCGSWLDRPFAPIAAQFEPKGPPGLPLESRVRGPTPPFNGAGSEPPACRVALPFKASGTGAPRHAIQIGEVLFVGLTDARHLGDSPLAAVPVLAILPRDGDAAIALVSAAPVSIVAGPVTDLGHLADRSDPDTRGDHSNLTRVVRCTALGDVRAFPLAFVVDGRRCVTVTVTSDGHTEGRTVPFGRRRCPNP
jgi:hypothetical protein